MSSKTDKPTPDMAVMVKGQYDYGFTILPNVLRDEVMPLAGTDAFVLAYIILSWGGKGERGAAISSRYLAARTRWSTTRTRNAKEDLLKACGEVFSMIPGDQAASRPETWWVDYDALNEMHHKYLLRQKEEQQKKRGPGRPKKPASGIAAGIPEDDKKPASGINTGFLGFADFLPKNLLRESQHPCFGNRSTPASGIAALKEKDQIPSERKVVVEAPDSELTLGADSQVESPVPLSNNNKNQAEPETAPPVGGSADADITDEELEFLFETNHQVAVSVNDTETENVPPAAPPAPAAAQEAQEAPAAFAPGSESRAEVTGLLSARLGGKSRLKTLLSEPGRDNVRQKASWLDLEPARVRAIVEEAQAKCAAEGVTYVTAITRRLDAALGARDASSLAERPASASATPGTLGAAYEVKPSVVVAELTGQASQPEESESPRKFVPGAEWRGPDGQTVTIKGQEGARYLLSDGQKLLAFELTKSYAFIEDSA